MDLMIRGRGNGKTTDLIRWMVRAPHSEKRVMICYCDTAAREMIKEYARSDGHPERVLEAWQFITYASLETLRGRPGIVLCVDNIDLFMDNLFNRHVARSTASNWTLI